MNDLKVNVNVNVNRTLLNPRFDGYKLSTCHSHFHLASIPLPRRHFPLQPNFNSGTKSYALTAAYFAFNNLVSLTPSLVALIDSTGHLVIVSLKSNSVVATLPLWPSPSQSDSSSALLPPSLLLVRSLPNHPQQQCLFVLVADGCGSLRLVRVPLAAPNQAAIVGSYHHPQPAVVADALCTPTENASDAFELHLAIYSLASDTISNGSATTTTKFQGAHLVFDAFSPASSLNLNTPLTPTRVTPTWMSSAHPVLAQVSPDASTMLLASTAPIHAQPVAPRTFPHASTDLAPAEPSSALSTTVFQSQHYTFRWHQTSSDVTLHLTLASRATKHAVQSAISATHVSLALRLDPGDPATSLLCILSHAPLWAPILPDDSLWTLEDQGCSLTLHLEKRDHGTRWPQVWAHGTPSDSVPNVLETVDASEQAAHVEQMAKYTQDHDVGDAADPLASGSLATMTDPKEDIDLMADQSRTYLARVSTLTCQLMGASTCGAYLCPVHRGAGSPPGMCVKSDVDGLVYAAPVASPLDDQALSHVATAHAFAYIQASKRDRRMSVATDKWAAIVHVTGGVYLYVFGRERQARCAPQYVVECGSGEGGDEVVGVVAVGAQEKQGEEALGRLVVIVGHRVVCVDVDALVLGM